MSCWRDTEASRAEELVWAPPDGPRRGSSQASAAGGAEQERRPASSPLRVRAATAPAPVAGERATPVGALLCAYGRADGGWRATDRGYCCACGCSGAAAPVLAPAPPCGRLHTVPNPAEPAPRRNRARPCGSRSSSIRLAGCVPVGATPGSLRRRCSDGRRCPEVASSVSPASVAVADHRGFDREWGGRAVLIVLLGMGTLEPIRSVSTCTGTGDLTGRPHCEHAEGLAHSMIGWRRTSPARR